MEEDVMHYFPDICHKRVPPRKYFWQVFYVLRNDLFKSTIENHIVTLKLKNKIKDDNIKLTPEAQKIFNDFNFTDDLQLLGKINS